MKKMVLVFLLGFLGLPAFANAEPEGEKCYQCSTASKEKCNQCRMGSKDTADARKKCEKAGCKVVGTGSCSTSANIKVCG